MFTMTTTVATGETVTFTLTDSGKPGVVYTAPTGISYKGIPAVHISLKVLPIDCWPEFARPLVNSISAVHQPDALF